MTQARPPFTLTQLTYFVRVAELGSMTAASEELYVAQSAVSSAVHQLESSLGATLFIRRRSRGVQLTDQGRAFFTAALNVLNSADEAMNCLRPDHLSGHLHTGCFTTLAPFWLPEIFEEIRLTCPDVRCTIDEVTASEVERRLNQRELDAVFTYSFDYGRSVDVDIIAEAPVYAAFSADSPLAARSRVSLTELVDLPLILLDLDKSSGYFLSLFRDLGLKPQVHQRFGSFEVVRSMVARGHGYTILNQSPSHDLTNDGRRIVKVPITDVRSHLLMGVAHRAGEPMTRKTEAFAEACRNVLLQANVSPVSDM
ncbi:MAG: LysR family transcriptional regulator [Corynebacterium provencense]|jgi:DNA-binding transcriptional LysR family regulator|uniref:LysR family transcriptional regulator n=1 Tax=Corynebacterium provencense TaxID=1737425 RepID=UPI002989EEB1|nr:LysR family transcriptional regulator [Corynebacterium provencense]